MGATAPETRDTHHPHDNKSENPSAQSSDTASTTLSQQATKPGDQTALRTVKSPTDTSNTGLPDVQVTTDKTPKPAPRLDDATLLQTAIELHEALGKRKWLGMRGDADSDKVMHLLGPLGAQDRAALEKIYHDKFDPNGKPDLLRHDLKDKLGKYDFRKAESALNTSDGRTNDAGALMVALTHAKDDKERGNAEARAVLQTLNSKQIAQLDEDFKKQYGQSYLDALKNADLTKATKDALPYLEKGVDKRTSDDLLKLAHVAVDNGDRRLFSESIRGDSPEAVAARKAIMEDSGFKDKIAEKFPSEEVQNLHFWQSAKDIPLERRMDPVALDYLKEGRISLATITSADTGKWIFDNKSNIELASKNASDKERQDFSKGREIASSGKAPANDQEKQQLEFYNKIHDAFKKGGNDREVSIWQDQLIHGRETIVSDMAKTHSDGWGPFSWGAGTNKNDLMTRVESLSKEDWTMLKGPDGARFRKEIEDSLNTYADKGERTRVLQMLDQKVSKDTYEDAAKVHRNLADTREDNKGSAFLWFGTSYDGKNVIKKFIDMTPEDAAKYKNDPAFKKDIDGFLKDHLNETEKLLAQRLLKQVEATGQPPKPDAIDTLLADQVNGEKPQKLVADAEKVLQDEALRARLNKPYDQLSDEDKKIKASIENTVTAAVFAGGYPPEYGSYEMMQRYTKPLFETGHVPADLKLELGFDKKDLLPQIAAAPPAERDAAMKRLSAEEQQVVQAIQANKDAKPDLADRIRTMAIGAGGDPADFKSDLTKLSFADRQSLKDEYSKKYHHDLDADFLSKVKADERSSFIAVLTPAETDGRQRYYDNYHRMLQSESGFSADGSKLTLERANDLYASSLEEYQKVYKTLPPEKQEALDKYFGDALEQYKASKEKLAEIVVDATITAVALAATPFTGGASLAAVVAIAAASGAAFRLGAMKVIEGNDFDSSAKNVLKQLVLGGSAAALNFIGMEAFTGAGALVENVSARVLADLATTAGKDILTAGGKEVLEAGLPKLIQAGGEKLAAKDVAALVLKAAPDASPAARQALEESLIKKAAELYPQEQAIIAEQVANRSRAEAAKHFVTTEVKNSALIGGGSNIASSLIAAPFNEGEVDWEQLKTGGLIGLGIGAVIPVALKPLIAVAGATKGFVTNLTRDAEGFHVDPHNITEPVTFKNTKTGEVRTVEPGKGDSLKLTKDWQPEAGGKPLPDNATVVDTDGKPVKPGENPETFQRTDAPLKPEGTRAEAVEPHKVMEYQTRPGQPDVVADPEAVAQSNAYKENGEVRGKLKEGFQSVGGETRVGPDGNWSDPNRPGIVYDRGQDKVLRDTIAEAHARLDQFKNDPKRLAEEMSAFSKEKMEPAGWTSKQVDDADALFRSESGNKRILLGDYIERAGKGEGAGPCQPQAMLMKVLGDEFGLDLSMSTGYLGKVPPGGIPTGYSPNHAFTELHLNNETLVFDPRNNITGTPIDRLPHLTPSREFGTSDGIALPQAYNVKAGDTVSHDSTQWKVSNETPTKPGDLVLRRDGQASLTPAELAAANPGKSVKVGAEMEIEVAGKKDGGWIVQGTNADGTIRLAKADAIKLEVSPSELAAENSQIARALGRDNHVLSGPNDLKQVQTEINTIERKVKASGLSAGEQTKLLESIKAHLQSAEAGEVQALAKQIAALDRLGTRGPALRHLLDLAATNPEVNLKFALRADLDPRDLQAYAKLAVRLDKTSALPPEFQAQMQKAVHDRIALYNAKANAPASEIGLLRNQADNVSDAFTGFARNPKINPEIGKDVISLLKMGGDRNIRLAFGEVMAADADRAAVKMYTDLTKQSLSIDIAASSKGGHIEELAGFDRLRSVAAEGKLGDGWVFVPSANGSVADSAGIDGAFLNVKTKEWVPVDLALNPSTVAKKIREGKGDWALALRDARNQPLEGQDLATAAKDFLNRSGNLPPHLDITKLQPPYGNGSIPMPEFRKVLTLKEADVLGQEEGTKIFTTSKAIDRFESDIQSSRAGMGEPEASFYNELEQRAHSSFTPRRLETELASDVLPNIGSAVDVRVNPNPPTFKPLHLTQGVDYNLDPRGVEYIEFPRTASNSPDITSIRVYQDGNVVGVGPQNNLQLGSLKSFMDRAERYAQSDSHLLTSTHTKTPLKFDFRGKSANQILKDYPAMQILGDAIENSAAVRQTSTDSIALGRMKTIVDKAARTDSTLAQLSEQERIALAKDTNELRLTLKKPKLSPSEALTLRQIKNSLPEGSTWENVVTAQEGLEQLGGLPPSEAQKGLLVAQLKAAEPTINTKTASEVDDYLSVLDVDKTDPILLKALAKRYIASNPADVVEDLEPFTDFFKSARLTKPGLTAEDIVKRYNVVLKQTAMGWSKENAMALALK
ncbi:hypothetical protein BH10CYA1_BH10CYA1_34340 [soil metagenome]